jgi:hypothetical protein
MQFGQFGLGEAHDDEKSKRSRVQSIFAHKPYALSLLRYLMRFLSEVVEHSHNNKMTAHNLAVVFTPNLIRVDEPLSTSNSDQNNYATVPSSQQEALANATLYLKQMNQGISLVEKMIITHSSFL